MVNEWTREDLPSLVESVIAHQRVAVGFPIDAAGIRAVLDTVVDRLNAEFPKSRNWRRAHEIVEAERDQARRERDEWKQEHDLLVVHGSVRSDTYAAMVRDRDDWRDKACNASEGMRKAVARAEAAEARTAPAVTREEIEKAVRVVLCGDPDALSVRAQAITDAVWSLVSGADPAVFVVREGDIAAVEVQTINGGKWWLADGALVNMCESPTESEAQEAVDDAFAVLVGALAARRAIEAEQAVDPVEEKAEELMRVLAPETEDRTWGILTEPAREDFRRLARHVLGQEAKR